MKIPTKTITLVGQQYFDLLDAINLAVRSNNNEGLYSTGEALQQLATQIRRQAEDGVEVPAQTTEAPIETPAPEALLFPDGAASLTEEQKNTLKAWADGENWVKSLKAGDKFLGAGPAAEAAGYDRNSAGYQLFITAAFAILDSLRIYTDARRIHGGWSFGHTITRIEPKTKPAASRS